MNHKVKKN